MIQLWYSRLGCFICCGRCATADEELANRASRADQKKTEKRPSAALSREKPTPKLAERKAPLGEGMVRLAPTEQIVPADQRPTITTILWTIYLNPADAPGQAVLRPHACLRDGRVLAGTRSWIRPTVADCRALIPKSATRLNVADPDKTIQAV